MRVAVYSSAYGSTLAQFLLLHVPDGFSKIKFLMVSVFSFSLIKQGFELSSVSFIQ